MPDARFENGMYSTHWGWCLGVVIGGGKGIFSLIFCANTVQGLNIARHLTSLPWVSRCRSNHAKQNPQAMHAPRPPAKQARAFATKTQ